MIALPRTLTGRAALAIALSVLIHAIVLLVPQVRLPSGEAPPPLTAKLEPLPQIAAKPAAFKKPKAKPRSAPYMPEKSPPGNKPAENTQTEEPQIAPSPQIVPGPQSLAIDDTPDKMLEETRPAHPFPKHAQLTFIAYQGTAFRIGEARHRLEIGNDKSYTLRVGMNTTGLASIFKAFESDQQSSGILTAQGLRPVKFSETRNTSKGKESFEAKFSWEEKLLSFSNGNSAPLPEQTQDIISFLYQLPQLELGKGTIPVHISNGKKLESYELVAGEEEAIQSGLGELRALPLRKIHAQGEEGLDIWLGLEYRLLPVKIRMIDRAGQIAGEMVISEIRVADE